MKILQYIAAWVFAIALLASCNEGIDPINPASPGSDVDAPVITISSPTTGGVIKLPEGSGMLVNLVAEDDIELESVSILIDGAELETITDFTDYRRFAPIGGYLVEGLETGGHTLQILATDKTGKSTSSEELAFTVIVLGSFTPAYGEIFYMGFDNHLLDLVSLEEATVVGEPGFFEGKIGMAYAGETDAYLTVPLEGLAGEEFSATFWYNVNSTPDRSGILTVGSPSADGLYRNDGFRLFREGSATNQILKLNLGNGTVDSWLDGGPVATLIVEDVDWVHIAFTISATHVALYFDGVVVSETDAFGGPISWANCETVSIASGLPTFFGWSHFSDLSLMDELRFFDKALSQEEIQAIIDAEL